MRVDLLSVKEGGTQGLNVVKKRGETKESNRPCKPSQERQVAYNINVFPLTPKHVGRLSTDTLSICAVKLTTESHDKHRHGHRAK